MADTREIKIVLETRGGAGGSEEQRVDTETNAEVAQQSGSESSGKAAAKALIATVAAEAVNEGMAWASYYINREMNLNDDYIGQRNLQIATKAVNWAASSAGTVSSSALAGAAFGPVGAVIGALVGVGMVAAKTARENIQAMDQQNIMLNQMQAQLDYTRQRSGWSTKAASIGENL